MAKFKLKHIDVTTIKYKRKSDGKTIEKTYYYYRRDDWGRERIRLPGLPMSQEFMDRYAELEAQALRPDSREGVVPGSFDDLIARYKASSEFQSLKDKTRGSYTQYLDIIGEKWGKRRVRDLRRSHIYALRDAYAQKPQVEKVLDAKGRPKRDKAGRLIYAEVKDDAGETVMVPTHRRANYLMQVMSVLMAAAVDYEFRETNPALKMRKLKTSDGYKAWTEADVIRFLQSAPSFQARQAVLLGFWLGQRISDIVALKWTDFDGSGFAFTQQKTSKPMFVAAHPDLIEELSAWPKDRRRKGRKRKTTVEQIVHHEIILTPRGEPYTVSGMIHLMRRELDKAGMTDLSFHGIRKLATSRLIDAGNDVAHTKSVTGHNSDSMVSHYDKGADQKVRAITAISRLPSIGGKRSSE